MPRLPALDVSKRVNHSQHIVILGAGASRAATPDGDAHGRRLPVMADLLETLSLPLHLRSYIAGVSGDFEVVYSTLHQRDPADPRLRELEQFVRSYLAGLQLPAHPTSYDRLLLSLREKDLVATFNWDPLLVQALLRNRAAAPMPHILFLHGNVAIGMCAACRVKGLLGNRCHCGSVLKDTPLLFPIASKDYDTDPFISSEWNDLRFRLQQAYMLTVFGYGAPTSDASAIRLMQDAWAANETRELAETNFIDIQDRATVESRWDHFIVRQHYGVSRSLDETYLLTHPRRSCEALAFASLQLAPWRDNRMPQLESLEALHRWIHPLVREEAALEGGGALSGDPCPAS